MFKKLLLLSAILLSNFSFGQQEVQIGNVTNNIVLGPFAGNRDLAFGVKNILEEVIQDEGHYLSPNSDLVIEVELLYFDVKKTNVQLAVYGKTTDQTEIIAQAILKEKGKIKKKVVAKGTAKSTSVATLIIDKGGKFSQTDVSTSLKKVCEELIIKLKI
jgi:uncharacterized lipoprotein YajG